MHWSALPLNVASQEPPSSSDLPRAKIFAFERSDSDFSAPSATINALFSTPKRFPDDRCFLPSTDAVSDCFHLRGGESYVDSDNPALN